METRTETRDKIIQVATDLLYRRGYEALGVKEICQRAGASKSSFYHFFPSKEDLALAVIDGRWHEVRGAFAMVRAQDLPALARLRSSFAMMYQISRQTHDESGQVFGCPFGSLGSELAPFSPRLRGRIAEVFSWMEGQYRAMLEDAITKGELPADFAAETAGRAILATVQGMSVLGKVHNSPELLQQTGDALLEVILNRAA